jgi:uncharacterized protein (TIGR02117 family)
MKLILKFFVSIFALITVLIIMYVICAWALPKIVLQNADIMDQKNIDIFIKTNGVHTDIVLPVITKSYQWNTVFTEPNHIAMDSNYKYVAIGWGDKGFYLHTPTWADLKLKTAFHATFGLGSSALHITYYTQLQENKNCVKIKITEKQYNTICKYMIHSMPTIDTKLPTAIQIITDANYGITDCFYEAKGKYTLFNTCNTWANNCLKNAGLKSCWWTVTDAGIFDLYK